MQCSVFLHGVCTSPTLLCNTTLYGQSHSHAYKRNTAHPHESLLVHIKSLVLIQTSVSSLYRSHTHAQPYTAGTPCPHLSSPSLLSAQLNSIRRSSHCCHGSRGVGRHAHQNLTTGIAPEQNDHSQKVSKHLCQTLFSKNTDEHMFQR